MLACRCMPLPFVMLALLLFSVLLLLPPPCRCEDQQQQIFGGNTFNKDQFLWFVALLEGFREDDFLCSGALISPRHVITADHCLQGRSVDSYWARVGYYCPKTDNCLRTFVDLNVIEHRRDPSLGDVAILVLASKAPSKLFPPAIPDVGSLSYLSNVSIGGELLMVGAGRDGTREKVTDQAETLRLQLKHANFKKCRKEIKNKLARRQFVSKATICSLSDQGKPCQGDSGAAVLVENVDVEGDVIVAVHNYGPRDCSGADDSVVFGHVALSYVAEFVLSVVCGGNKKPQWCTETSCSSPPPSPECTAELCAPLLSEEVCAPFISEEVCAPVCDSMPPTSNIPVPDADSLKATLVHNLEHRTSRVTSLAFDASSSRFVSGGWDAKVNMWDPLNGGSPLTTFELDDCCPRSMAFNPIGTMLAVDDGINVAILDVSNTNPPNEVRMLEGHRDDVDGVAWNADGIMLASGSDDNDVRLWDVNSGTLLQTFEGHEDQVESVAFDRQGRYLASASDDSTVRVWDVVNMTHVRTLEGHTSDVRSVAYSPDGTKLASGSWDKTLRVWIASDGAPLGVFSVGALVDSVAWSPDSRFLVTSSRDGIVRIWDASNEEGDALLELTGHSEAVYAVAWSPNGKWIVSGGGDDLVKVWEIGSD